MYGSWDKARNGRTDERTEKATYWGGCPTKNWENKSIIFMISIKNQFQKNQQIHKQP